MSDNHPVTPEQRDDLREKAEKARDADATPDPLNHYGKFMHACSPDVILALVQQVRRAEQQRDLFRWALDRYGKHDPACGDNQGSCSCGLREAEDGKRPPWRDPIAAERDRMRAALNTIAYEPIGEPEASVVQIYSDIVKIARAALSAAETEGK
jgi:hypothetical protein